MMLMSSFGVALQAGQTPEQMVVITAQSPSNRPLLWVPKQKLTSSCDVQFISVCK